MNRLPIEIENEIWSLYYSNIYYTNVISVLSRDSLIGCGIVNTNVDTDVFNTWGLKKY